LIFDLEEAVRNRDASQIRTILRRYEFDREQLINSQDDAQHE